MVVTIWCAIGTEREGDFAGKTASRNAPDHMVFLANKLFPGGVFTREIRASGLTLSKQANADQ
jgi:hypothetical protein